MTRHRKLLHVMGFAAVLTPPVLAQAAEKAESVDWFYVVRGFVFIFASALGAVWLGRRITRNRK